MQSASISKAAQIIWATWQDNKRMENIPADCRPQSRAEGYKVQAEVARRSGQRLYGWKIAATSTEGQKHIGVDGPLAGRLLQNRTFDSGAAVPLAHSLMKVAEAEFAFKMARDLTPRARPYSMEEVLDAVQSLHPAIEIPDSRYEDFIRVGAAQLIADNACASYFVLGPATPTNWRTVDLAKHEVVARIDGNIAGQGIGANVLGDPRIALTWIANELSTIGETLAAGQVVTTGTCLKPVAIRPGNHVLADFGLFGKVEARLAA
jgi:2-keto-4-pentenoate hydratase